MKHSLLTERFLLREIDFPDADDLFEMDADPAVHRYIHNKPVQKKEEIVVIIDMIRQQYVENGIGRWAVVDKETKECVGWAGLKYIREEMNGMQNFYELGYRFKQRHWRKGIATEVGKAIVEYGFANFEIRSIYAITHPSNEDSMKVLKKLGFVFVERFEEDGNLINWFELRKKE